MKTYETIFIVPADLPSQRLDGFLDKIKSLITKQGGEIVQIDKWGRRRLAYAINRHREGFYVFIVFKAPSEIMDELTQIYRVSEDVIRQMTCRAIPSKTAAPAAQSNTKEAPNAQVPAPAPAQ